MSVNVGILIIATNKYKTFINNLIFGIDEFFMIDKDVSIFLFIDDENFEISHFGRLNIIKIIIPSYGWPAATLYRYKIFNDNKKIIEHCSHLFYSDVDMAIVENVGEEILGEGLTAVIHPGFYNGGGSWETRPESKTYVPPEKRKKYYAGGFQGGSSVAYLEAAKTMAAWIDEDEKNGILPIWHDESAWNKYLSEQKEFIELDSGYCMVQQNYLREQWGISHLTPRIIALSKDHKSIRE